MSLEAIGSMKIVFALISEAILSGVDLLGLTLLLFILHKSQFILK